MLFNTNIKQYSLKTLKDALKSLKPLNPTIKLTNYKNKTDAFNKLLSLGYDFSLLTPKRRVRRSRQEPILELSRANSVVSSEYEPSLLSSMPSQEQSTAPNPPYFSRSRVRKNPYAVKPLKKRVRIPKKLSFLENVAKVVKNIPKGPDVEYKKQRKSIKSDIQSMMNKPFTKSNKLKIIKEPKINKPKKVNNIIYVSPQDALKSASLFDKPINVPSSKADILKPIALLNEIGSSMAKNKVKRNRNFDKPINPPVITSQEKKKIKNKTRKEKAKIRDKPYIDRYKEMLKPV